MVDRVIRQGMNVLMAMVATAILFASVANAQVEIDGFIQGLFGGSVDNSNPASTEQTVSETRLQLRMEHFGDDAEMFARLDFLFDGADSVEYDWELREGYLKFRLGSNFDFKIGRQILTWGTGDLIFINDVFAKDYRSFFIGRDDQYLKAPQNAWRTEYFSPLGNLSVVWSPRFEPNRLPRGSRLSFFSPVVGNITGEAGYIAPRVPLSRFKNSELATRFSRQVGNFTTAAYFYHGFYKNPLGASISGGSFEPIYPRLDVYGGSVRGQIAGGILWLEGGYFDSRDDNDGANPLLPNSSFLGMVGYEKQIAANLTANLQWQIDLLSGYDSFTAQQPVGLFVRDELRHLLTSRITKLLKDELITLSAFVFYSPSDEDGHIRLFSQYKYSDELILSGGANLFFGENRNSEFGQFQKNDNVYSKLTYGF